MVVLVLEPLLVVAVVVVCLLLMSVDVNDVGVVDVV